MVQRGRPKGSKNKPKVVTPAAAAPGHNSGELSDEQRQALTLQHKGQYVKALAAKKAADAALKNVCKKAKSELGEYAVDDIKLAIELDTDEGIARLKADMERQARMARWFGLPLGSQAGLFSEDRTPVEDKAFAEGKRAGMGAELRSAPSRYPQQVADRWYAGYDAGQNVVRADMKDAFTAPTVPGDGDPFDDVLPDEGEIDDDSEGESDVETEDETETA
ncbi:hypothetical protein [Azorhizobium doebereinerae]|uniref:hypothetical protein n=1 Tax=Azorhizobium doebereinerae TaxID=281091 RepID=UPI000491AC6C|nr:hypothetical protein [Azorhizobium doebereinerae]